MKRILISMVLCVAGFGSGATLSAQIDLGDYDQIGGEGLALVVYQLNSTGGETEIDCGQGGVSISPVPINGSRTFNYRMRAEAVSFLHYGEIFIDQVTMEIGDYYVVEYPNGFDGALAEGETLDFNVVYRAGCYGQFFDRFFVSSSAGECDFGLGNQTDNASEPVLGADMIYVTDEAQTNLTQETVLPGNLLPIFHYQFGGYNIILLQVRNYGNSPLVIDDMIISGGITVRENQPDNTIVFGEEILPGENKQVFLLINQPNCENKDITVTFMSNASESICGTGLNYSSFDAKIFYRRPCRTDWPDVPGPIPWGGRRNATTENTPQLFPTIAAHQLTLNFTGSETGTAYTIFSSTGQSVQSGRLPALSHQNQLNVTHLSPGHYYIRLAGVEQPLRFVKQ